jgi:tetratricopeptide (TPR) repeat protein
MPGMSIDGNTFKSSGGMQNAGIGDGAIGQQNNYYDSPPPAPPPIPHCLPSLDTCFLGRDKQLAELLPLLHPGKVVAVCGPGGMGKSALAAQAVHQLEAGRFPDGIILYSFYGKHSVAEAVAYIVRSYDEQQQDTSFAAASRLLANKRALLILDGAEEADDLPALLRLRGGCGVLITSRKRSDAHGARLDLKPLAEQDAAAVFRQYSGVAADDASVQGICKILGGWPVGLRIAGRYCSSTGESAAGYLRWLEQEPFKELASGEHQEENAALLLRRSVAQVSDDARLVLGLAGCLAFAPIARAPVAAILESDERRARTALNELVNYGLLEKREERWQISHALVHTYARTELAMSKESLERLAGWYINFCEAASAEGVKGYARLDAERMHCLRLMESCLASGLWLEVKGLVGAIDIYLERQGHWTERLAALEMALTAARQAGTRRDEAWCLNELGLTGRQRGGREKALKWYEQSLPIARELGDRQGEGTILNNIATIYEQQGKYELALQQYEQSLSILREIGDRDGEGTTLNNIGTVYKTQGDNETALQYYEQCLPIRRKAGDEIGTGQTLNNLATIYRAQGKPVKALRYHKQALAIRQQLGDRAGEAQSRWNIGLTYKDLGDFAQAEEYISLAVQIAEQIGSPYLGQFREGLAWVRAAGLG